MILRFMDARKIHPCLLKLCLKYLVISTATPIVRNQIVKKNDIFPRYIVVTASWISPQTMNVNNKEMATGHIFFKGLKMNFPK